MIKVASLKTLATFIIFKIKKEISFFLQQISIGSDIYERYFFNESNYFL